MLKVIELPCYNFVQKVKPINIYLISFKRNHITLQQKRPTLHTQSPQLNEILAMVLLVIESKLRYMKRVFQLHYLSDGNLRMSLYATTICSNQVPHCHYMQRLCNLPSLIVLGCFKFLKILKRTESTKTNNINLQ